MSLYSLLFTLHTAATHVYKQVSKMFHAAVNANTLYWISAPAVLYLVHTTQATSLLST